MSTGDRVQVRVTHRFTASPERVFDAFLDPARAGKFMFATPSGQMVKVEIDARVGGKFAFVDRREGEDVAHTGEYLVIDRPRRLVFTLAVEKYSQEIDQVEIAIVPRGRGCELTLTHGMSAAWKDRKRDIEQGWAGILEGLEAQISNAQTAISFLREVAAGRVHQAYDDFVAPDFRHHNPYFRGDRASLQKAMAENALKNPDKVRDVKHAIEAGDLVAVHSHIRQRPDDRGGAVVHLFRFAGASIAELWDVGQDIPADVVNENGAF
jgi:uncharacterized protein YndB with AHSA1/START domain/predicted SnoaL-like aldol condensation-catalyzing enzyme